jgi:hypothetical protein
MTRRRLDELLAAGALAPTQLARAQQQGANEAATTSQWTGLIKQIPALAGTLIDTGKKAADEDAAVAEQKAITAKQTDPLDDMVSGSWNPFAAGAADKAKADAEAKIEAARTADADKAAAKARQEALDAQNAANAKSEADLRAKQSANVDSEIAARGAQTADAEKRRQLEEDKADADFNIKSFEEQDKRAALDAKAKRAAGGAGAAPKQSPKIASSLADVADFKSALDNASVTADKIDGGHVRQVLTAQKIAKGASEHGGITGVLAGALADNALGTGDMTNDEAKLVAYLAAIRAKSVKGLEGAHRAVSQHQIELVDGALNALSVGNIGQFKTQLAALKKSAEDTEAAIHAEGLTPSEAAGVQRPYASPTSPVTAARTDPLNDPFADLR